MDFWAPEMVNANMEATFQKVKDLIFVADFVTIATSPGFIDQDLADTYIVNFLEIY